MSLTTPMTAYFYKEDDTCQETFDTEVRNPKYAIEIPKEYWGPEELGCEAHAFKKNHPPVGCRNLYGVFDQLGMIYLEDVKVVPNVLFGLHGGWKIKKLLL